MAMVPKLIQSLFDTYRHDPRVVGLLLAGSAAHNKADRFSDIDLYILTQRTLGYTRRLLARQPVLIDCISDTVSEARVVLQRERGMAHRPFAHYLAHGRILWQHGQEMTQVQKLAERTLAAKTKMTRSERIMHQYSLDDFLSEMARDQKRGDQPSFDAYRHLFLDNALDFFAKITGEVLPPPRHVLQYINRIDVRAGREFRTIMSNRPPIIQYAAASRLYRRLNKLVGGSLRGDIRIRPTT